MNNSSATPTWPMMVFWGMSAVSLTVYLVVFVCLLRLRCASEAFNSTFYSLLMHHSIADLLTMVFFIATNPMRTLPGIREFYFNYQKFYITAASYNSVYYFLYVRCTGIVLLSIQRYCAICHQTSMITEKIKHASKLQIALIYWTLPTIISIVVLKDVNFSYDTLERMAIIADQEVIQRNTLMALIVVALTCIACSLAYGALFNYIRKNNSKALSKSVRREVNLAFQVFVLIIALFAILMYYAFQNYFSQTHNTGPIFYMRALYPIANGLLSYVNPFCILFLNKDLARQIVQTVTCHKYKRSEVQVNGKSSSTVLQPRRAQTLAIV